MSWTNYNSTNAKVTPNLKWADVASATTTDIWAVEGNLLDITWTTAITGLWTANAWTEKTLQFDWILTLTYNATSLILPTSANITTAVWDTAIFISLWSGNWLCTNYQRKNWTALVSWGGGSYPSFSKWLFAATAANVIAVINTTYTTSADFTMNSNSVTCNFDWYIDIAYNVSFQNVDNDWFYMTALLGWVVIAGWTYTNYNNDETDIFTEYAVSNNVSTAVSNWDIITFVPVTVPITARGGFSINRVE